MTPGKYTYYNMKIVIRHIETEMLNHPQAIGYAKSSTGKWHLSYWSELEFAEFTPGWPLELVAGRWYRDNEGAEWLIHAVPAFHNHGPFAGYQKAYGRFFRADGSCEYRGSNLRLVEECECPAWSKETT